MSKLHLVIGNKNYSAWTMRPWMALSMAGIPFHELLIPLDTPETAGLIAQHSAAGRVPVLHHGRQRIWESLAIMEYLAELFPEKHLWPKAVSARASPRRVERDALGLRRAAQRLPDEHAPPAQARADERRGAA